MARQTGVEHVNQFVTDPDGRLAAVNGVPAPTTGTVGALLGDAVTCPTYGMASVSVAFGGSGPTFAFEASWDGGVTYGPMQLWVPNLLAAGVSGVAIASTAVGMLEGGLPAGATNFRIRCTVASGAIPVTITPSPAPYRAAQGVSIVAGSAVALNAGSVRVGAVGAQTQAFFADETTTPLAGTGTATGASRDLTLTASGGAVQSTNAAFNEFRALGVSDVTGTLHVEVSADQVTWWRISTTATAAVGAIFYAQASVKPVTRYARAVYVNGAGAQATFLLSTSRYD